MSVIGKLYSSSFDSTRTNRPRMSIMIAATPRSGSTHFGIECWRTGLLGAPLEYPRSLANGNIYLRLGSPSSGRKYWHLLQQKRTLENGVFSYKMFVQDYRLIANNFRDLLPEITPTHVIQIVRRDQAAQAISYSRAIRSSAWFSDSTVGTKELEYDFEHILDCEKSLSRQHESWKAIFSMTGTKPHVVHYEDLLRDRVGVFSAIFRRFNMPWDGTFPLDIPSLTVQRGKSSEAWLTQYKAERNALESQFS